MIEVNYVCCSCKSNGIKKCVKCDRDVSSLCGCISDCPSKILELETQYGKPNVILRLCGDCEDDIIKNIKHSSYGRCI